MVKGNEDATKKTPSTAEQRKPDTLALGRWQLLVAALVPLCVAAGALAILKYLGF